MKRLREVEQEDFIAIEVDEFKQMTRHPALTVEKSCSDDVTHEFFVGISFGRLDGKQAVQRISSEVPCAKSLQPPAIGGRKCEPKRPLSVVNYVVRDARAEATAARNKNAGFQRGERHFDTPSRGIDSPAQRTAVKQRPHQETGRHQVVTTAPVVLHHGREGGRYMSRRGAAVCFNGLLDSEPSVWFDAPERLIGGELQFSELGVS
jgi:hypothetical protein